MRRPAASVISVLSDFVAKGRQAVHHFSSAPSKIPYGGFPPVRLQTGSPAATFARTTSRYGSQSLAGPGRATDKQAAPVRMPPVPSGAAAALGSLKIDRPSKGEGYSRPGQG